MNYIQRLSKFQRTCTFNCEEQFVWIPNCFPLVIKCYIGCRKHYFYMACSALMQAMGSYLGFSVGFD